MGHRKSLERHPFMYAIIVIAVILTSVPLVVLVMRCFVARWTGLFPTEWTLRGFETFARNSDKVISATEWTLAIGLMSSIISTVIGMMIGRYFADHEPRHPLLNQIAVFLSIIIPTTVFGLGMRTVFIWIGLANSFPAVIFANVCINIPYVVTIMTEVNRATGTSLEEEARVLGASRLRAYLVGTLPSVLPGVFVAMAYAFMMAINNYFVITVMSTGRVPSLITSIVMPAVSDSPGPAAALYSVYFIAFTIIAYAIFQKLSNMAVKRVGKNLA